MGNLGLRTRLREQRLQRRKHPSNIQLGRLRTGTMVCRNQTINSIGYFFLIATKHVAMHEGKPEDVSNNYHTGSRLLLVQFLFSSGNVFLSSDLFLQSLTDKSQTAYHPKPPKLFCFAPQCSKKYAWNNVIKTQLGISSMQGLFDCLFDSWGTPDLCSF